MLWHKQKLKGAQFNLVYEAILKAPIVPAAVSVMSSTKPFQSVLWLGDITDSAASTQMYHGADQPTQ